MMAFFQRLLLLLLCCYFHAKGEKTCGNRLSEDKKYVQKYSCPLPDGPSDKTECCDPAEYRCCRAKAFYEIPQWQGILIAVCVIGAAALLGVVIVVCCCWERCPLYMACRAEAKLDYIAHPHEVEGLDPMPSENVKNVRVYMPNEDTKPASNFV